nr:DUF2085 domain-containing protein [Bacillus sp. THAF10]
MKSFFTLEFFPCHRRRERSLVIRGKQFPICYRCMSILLGYLVIFPLFFIASTLSFLVMIIIGFALIFPMVLDGYTQWKGWRMSNNFLRVLTGLVSGVGMSFIMVACIVQFPRGVKAVAVMIEGII